MELIIKTLYEQIIDIIVRFIKTRKNILISLGKGLLIIFLVLITINPLYYILSLWKFLNWNNGMILWTFNYRIIIYCIYPLVINQYKKDLKIQMLYGIEINKIAKYIISNGKFPRDEVSRYFGISRQTTQDIIDKLDEVNIFIRGLNNCRILDISLCEQDIIDRLIISPIIELPSNSSKLELNIKYDTEAEQSIGHTDIKPLAKLDGFTRRPLAKLDIS